METEIDELKKVKQDAEQKLKKYPDEHPEKQKIKDLIDKISEKIK